MARPSALFSRRIITHYKRDVRDSRGASETGRLLRTLAGRRRAPRWGTNTCCTVVRIAEEPRRNVRLTTQRRQQLHDRWLQTTADRTGRRFLASVAALQSDFFVSHQRTGHYCPHRLFTKLRQIPPAYTFSFNANSSRPAINAIVRKSYFFPAFKRPYIARIEIIY